jgi:hypothetical protein
VLRSSRSTGVSQGLCHLFGCFCPFTPPKWSQRGLIDLALDAIIFRIVVHPCESEMSSAGDATFSNLEETA